MPDSTQSIPRIRVISRFGIFASMLFVFGFQLYADAAVDAAALPEDKNTERLRAPIIPAWAFGHWIWEDVAHNRDAVEYMVGGYRSYGIPEDALIFDSPCFTAYNDFNWDEANYPNPQDMIDSLHARGVRVLPFYTGAINRKSSDTSKQKCDTYDFVVEHNFAINGNKEGKWWKGPALHVDFTNPDAIHWWETQLDKLTEMGIDGAKIDAAHGPFGSPVETFLGTMENREFGYHYFKQCFDYHTSRNPEFVAMTYAWATRRLVGWPSTSHVNWVGDFRGDWKGMKDQLKCIYLSVENGFSGVACEIGGYSSPASTKEQFIRYAQMACFMPIMINGGAFGALDHHLPWRHDAQTLKIYRDLVRLHKDLTPYLFSTGVDAHLNRSTIIQNVNQEKESHLLGPSLFVKAITSADETVTIDLPAESDWYDFWTNERYPAGSRIERSYPLDQYPVFVRAGAIVPASRHSQVFPHPENPSSDATTLVLYPGDSSQTRFHLPEGSGTSFHDLSVTYDAPGGFIEIQSEVKEAFCLFVKTGQRPIGVSGADSWSYDTHRSLLLIKKKGKQFTVRIETEEIPPDPALASRL